MDLVGVSLSFHDTRATAGVKHMEAVVIGQIDTGNEGIILRDSTCGNSTGALWQLVALLLLSRACVPGEHRGGRANLSSDCGVAVSVHEDAHDIIGVMVLVVCSLFGGVIDFTATKELLGVAFSVEDHTESGGHIDWFVFLVEIDILSAVGTSVAIDILQFVGGIRRLHVNGVVTIWLGNLSKPGTDSEELLTFTSIFHFEEVIFWFFLDIATSDTISLLVADASLCV